MKNFEELLSGGDLRSIGKSNEVIRSVHNQNDFDTLFKCLFHDDRIVVMRAADCIEKLTIHKPEYLHVHSADVFRLCRLANNKELVWHLALLIPRLEMNKKQMDEGWNQLQGWLLDDHNSRIVRVNALQGLFEISVREEKYKSKLMSLITKLKTDSIPSLAARIRIIRNSLEKK